MKKIIQYLNEAIKKEKVLVIFAFIIFFVGLIFGSLFINFISENDKKLLVEQLMIYITNISELSHDVFGTNVFVSELINNITLILLVFFLGISMIGIPVVILILFYKGFMLGTTISTIIYKYSFKGIIGSFLYIFPITILNICLYIFICFFAVNSSLKFLKAIIKKDNLNFKSFLGRYLLAFFISIFTMVLLCFVDSYISPLIFKLFTYLI